MPWTLRDAKRESAIVDNIDKGDDRSAAILAGAFLEDRLTLAIKTRLIPDLQVQGKLFKGYGPLATFAAKIDLAYLMGILNKNSRNVFHTIREIRNRFAHRLDLNDFNSPMVSDLCKKLFTLEIVKLMFEQTKKDFAASGELTQDKEFLLFVVGSLVQLPDTPRNSYMSTIKLNILILELGTAFAQIDRGDSIESFVLSLPSASLERSAQPPPRPPQSEGRAPRRRVRPPRSSRA
jgi:hypothetical protein